MVGSVRGPDFPWTAEDQACSGPKNDLVWHDGEWILHVQSQEYDKTHVNIYINETVMQAFSDKFAAEWAQWGGQKGSGTRAGRTQTTGLLHHPSHSHDREHRKGRTRSTQPSRSRKGPQQPAHARQAADTTTTTPSKVFQE